MVRKADLNIDFSGVESGGRSVPEGTYLVEVVSVEEKESSEGNAYLAWKWKVAEGEYKGTTLYDNTSLKPTALWRLKGLLVAMGYQVEGKFGLNLAEYKGKRVTVNTTIETYQGKEKSRIAEFIRGASTGGGTSSKPSLKGKTVTFEYEGESMSGKVIEAEGSKLKVKVEIDGESEVWEMDRSEVEVAE